MSTISERAQSNLGFEYFKQVNLPEFVQDLDISPPNDDQYVLRCPILIPGHDITLPTELEWCSDLVEASYAYQKDAVRVVQPFAYLTVRHGFVRSTTDDEYHVDGFSMKVPHIPEQNYVWASTIPTEVAAFPLVVPGDFNPLQHNVQMLLQDSMPDDRVKFQLKEKAIYAMDPYVFHRRPVISSSVSRTFIRLSMTPIPIDDVNNYTNDAFGTITSDYDGVLDFRDSLMRYPVKLS